MTDPRLRVTTYDYDSLGRTTKVTLPDPDGGGGGLAPWTTYTYLCKRPPRLVDFFGIVELVYALAAWAK